MNLLGLDISTSITGWTVLDKSGNIVEDGYVDLRKTKGLWAKTDHAIDELRQVIKKHNIQMTFVEESLQRFRPGFSSAHTLMTLAKFNGLLTYFVRSVTKNEPIYISAHEARKACNIPLNRKKGSEPIKLQVFKWVTHILNKTWPKTRHDNIQPWCYDIADSFVVAQAGLKTLQNES